MINGKAHPNLGPDSADLRGSAARQPFSEERTTLGCADKILRNGLLNLFGQGSLAVFHLVVVFVLARTLGKKGLGEFYTIFALIQVIQLVLEGGLSTVLTCRLTQNLSNWKKIVAEGAGLFTLVVVLSVGVMLGLGVVWSWWIDNPGRMTAFAFGAVACGAIQITRFCTGVFRAYEKVTTENFARIVHGATFAGIVFLLAFEGVRSTRAFLGAFALSHLLGSGYLLYALIRRLGWFGWSLNAAVLKDWLAVTLPLGLADIVRKWTWQLDTILLSLLQPAAVVGIYSVAYRPLGPLNWLPSAILAAVFPSLARMAVGPNSGSLERAFSHSVRLLWILSLPLAVAICIGAERLVVALAGAQFREAALPLQMLIWISTLSFVSYQFSYIFTALGRQRYFAVLVIAVFMIELVLEASLIPSWGYFGAIAGSMIGEVIFTVAGFCMCQRMGLARMAWKAMGAAALAGAGMAAVLWYFQDLATILFLAATLAATVLYFSLCVALGALEFAEVQRFLHAVGSLAGLRKKRKDLEAIPPVPPRSLELARSSSPGN